MPPLQEPRPAGPTHATGEVRFVSLDAIAPDERFRLRPDGDVGQLATSLGRLGQLVPVELRPAADGGDAPRWQVVAGFRRLAAVRMLARDRVLARIHDELSDADAWGIALGEALLHDPLTMEELEALRVRLRETGVAPWAEELVDEALVRAPVPAELRERFFDFLSGAAPAPTAAPEPGDAVAATEPAAASGRAAVIVLPAPELPGPGEIPPEWVGVDVEAVPPGDQPVEAAPLFAPDATPMTAPEALDGGEVVEVTPEELVQDLVARLSAVNQDLATAFEAWEDLPPEGRRAVVEQARYVAALLPFMEAKE